MCMKIYLALVACVLLSPIISAIELGQKIPEAQVKMKNVDEKLLSINESRGPKGTLVIFTCNHCPFVKAWLSRTIALGNEYLKKGVGVIAINANDPSYAPEDSFEEMQKAAKGVMNYAYVVDETGAVAKAFGATKTPEFYLFNAKDQLVYKGAIDSDSQNPQQAKAFLKKALDEVIAGKKVSNPETRALGCSIKFRPGKS